MAFKHGKNTVILWAQYNLSAYLNSTDVTGDIDLPTTTCYGASAVRRQVVGLEDAKATFGGLHDTTAGASQPVLTAALAAASASPVTVYKEGSTLGNPAILLNVREASLKTGSAVDAVVPIAVDTVSDGGVDFGVSLAALAAVTATGNGTSVDGLAATSNGGVGHIHCTAVAGSSPTNDCVIADSADNASFATILTFAQITAAGSQRVEITGNVRRYVRESHTIGGTGGPSTTVSVSFARR